MNSEKFSRYDSADYLKTDEDIAGYLEAAMEEGWDDPAFVAHALGVVARARNMSQLARDTGIIPTSADQNRWAQSRKPMDMIFQG